MAPALAHRMTAGGLDAKRQAGDTRVRALFVMVSLIGGGTEHVVFKLLESAAGEGISAELAVLDGRGSLENRAPSAIGVHDLMKRSRLGSLTATRNLRRLIARFQPEVIVSFLPLANVVAWCAGRTFPIPLVVNERTNTEAYLRFERLGWLWRRLLSPVYRQAFRVIANTQVTGRFLVEGLGVDPARLRVLPNPVDATAILSRAADPVSHPWFQPGQAPVVLGLGRLAAEKGFGRLIEAVALVRQGVPCRLVLLGEGPERSRLERLAGRSGIAEQVSFLGFQENPYPFLARSTLLAIPSAFEGFPNAAVEAMVCGTPVVGWQGVGGLDEISDQGRAALLVTPQTASALAEALLRVLTNASLRSSLAGEGRRRAEQYDQAGALPAFFAVLREAAGEGVPLPRPAGKSRG